MKIGREINFQSWTFRDSFFFSNGSPCCIVVALSESETQEPPTEVRHSHSVDKWWKRRMKMVASISDLKRHSKPSQRPTLGIHWAALVAQFRQRGGTIQLYTRHCRAVFRTCSTGWTAAIAFMGARWGASHQAWSRQTLRSCSLSPKVIIFYPAAGWLGPICPLGFHLGTLATPFFGGETRKNCAA